MTKQSAQKPRRGRTPSIDEARIAKAVLRVGRRGPLSMQSVAAELDVDVTTLYRHVGSVGELRRIGATLAAPNAKKLPTPEGETWESWLTAIAKYYREALHQNPDLIEYAQAALDPDFERLELATRILVGFGFEPRAAAFSHGFLINNVLGFVHQELREEEEAAQGRPAFVRLLQALDAKRNPEDFQTLRSLEFRPEDFDADTAFERFLPYVIEGIRAQPGAPNQERR